MPCLIRSFLQFAKRFGKVVFKKCLGIYETCSSRWNGIETSNSQCCSRSMDSCCVTVIGYYPPPCQVPLGEYCKMRISMRKRNFRCPPQHIATHHFWRSFAISAKANFKRISRNSEIIIPARSSQLLIRCWCNACHQKRGATDQWYEESILE